MDAQTLRRALADLFKFNPKDFFVRGTPTGYLVELASTRGRTSNVSDIENYLVVAQSITGTASIQTTQNLSYAATLTEITDAKPTVDTNCAANYLTNFNAGTWGTSRIQSSEYPLVMQTSYKRVSIFFASGPFYTGFVQEQKSLNSLMLSFIVAQDYSYRIAWRVTKRLLENGVTTDTVTTGSYDTQVTNYTGIVLTYLVPFANIITEAWPVSPDAPTSTGSTANSVTYIYEITNITRRFV